MALTYSEKPPQAFLDVLEKLLAERKYVTHLYLVEYDKSTVDHRSNQINIKIEDVVATPVKALRWDYLIGEDTINNRRFIIADSHYAQYLVDLYEYGSGDQHSRGRVRVRLHKFEPKRVEPHLIQKHHLSGSEFTGTLDLLAFFSPLEVREVISNTIEHDEFSNNLLKELKKTR